MTSNNFTFRNGEISDAAVLAELVNYAGEGLPLYSWEKMAQPGENAWDVGRRRAMREDGGFSYKNALMIDCDGEAAGALIGYEIGDVPEQISDDLPGLFVPLQELENEALGSWY